MKLIGQLLVWGSLAAGALAAVTGYLARLDAADEQLLGLTLAAPAGKVEQSDGSIQPIAEKDQPITPRLLAELRDAGVRNLRVKEFDFWRWRGRWCFLLSLAGLLLGACLTRLGPQPKSPAATGEDAAGAPESTLDALRGALQQLRRELAGTSDRSQQLGAIVDQIGRLQKTHMAAFIEARPALVSMLGLTGYAGLMDSYAAAERNINRAWSAAADKVYQEAVTCLDEAAVLIEVTRQKLSTARGEMLERPPSERTSP